MAVSTIISSISLSELSKLFGSEGRQGGDKMVQIDVKLNLEMTPEPSGNQLTNDLRPTPLKVLTDLRNTE